MHVAMARRTSALALLCAASCQAFLSFDGQDAGASVDAASSDAPTNADVALDATDASSPPVFSCNLVDAAFCADFDFAAGSFNQGWTTSEVDDGGTLARDLDAWVSPPGSLRATTSGQRANAALLKQVTTDGRSHVVVEADVLTPSIPSGVDPTAPFDIAFANPGLGFHALHFFVEEKGAWIQQYDQPPDASVEQHNYFFTTLFPSGTWVHVRVDVTCGAPGRIVVDLDGKRALDSPTKAVLPPGAVAAKVGIAYAPAQSTSWSFNVDNFVVYAD